MTMEKYKCPHCGNTLVQTRKGAIVYWQCPYDGMMLAETIPQTSETFTFRF